MKPQIADCIARFWSLRHSNWREPVSSSHNCTPTCSIGRSVAVGWLGAPQVTSFVNPCARKQAGAGAKFAIFNAASQCRPDTCYKMLPDKKSPMIASPLFFSSVGGRIITSWCQRPDLNTTESSRMIGLVIVRGCIRRHVQEFFVMQPITTFRNCLRPKSSYVCQREWN